MSASDSNNTIWQRFTCKEENDLSRMQQVEVLVSSFQGLPSYENRVGTPDSLRGMVFLRRVRILLKTFDGIMVDAGSVSS